MSTEFLRVSVRLLQQDVFLILSLGKLVGVGGARRRMGWGVDKWWFMVDDVVRCRVRVVSTDHI